MLFFWVGSGVQSLPRGADPSRSPALKSGERLQKAMERSTMLLMGKSTINLWQFSIPMLVHQRVWIKTAFSCGLHWDFNLDQCPEK